MTMGIRGSFRSICICSGIAIAAIGAAMLINYSPVFPRQNVPATKQEVSASPGAVKQPARPSSSPANQWVASYGKLPLAFEANEGQTGGQVKFLARGRGYALFLTGDEAVLTLRKSSAVSGQSSVRIRPKPRVRSQESGANIGQGTTDNRPRTMDSVLRMRLVGANTGAAVTGLEELPGKSNYFIGNDPNKWRTLVPNYAKVKYAGVYPGVDLVYYGNQGGQLEYDFVVAPGADPSVIALNVAAGLPRHASSHNGGVPIRSGQVPTPVRIASDGDLVLRTDNGEVRFHKPVIYQPGINNGQRATDNGLRTPVEGNFVLQANNQIGFKLASYDHTRPLVIDPELIYATYLGGTGEEDGYGIAVDSSGNAYVTGWTSSVNFPTKNPLQPGLADSANAFVTKFNPAGSALVYSTFLGGTGGTHAYAIAVDSSNNAYVTGGTGADFPTKNPCTACVVSSKYGGAFVTEVNAEGSALVYSTYLGGESANNVGEGIAVDSLGNAYVTGSTGDSDFPTKNAPQTACAGIVHSDTCAFVSKLNFDTSTSVLSLDYSTYLGGSAGDRAWGIAIDSSHNAYVTGHSGSHDFPTKNPLQATYGGVFVAKLNPAGSALVYSTYLGNNGNDVGYGIAVDSSDSAYVTGATQDLNFPSLHPLSPNNCYTSSFVTKINSAGSGLVFSTCLGPLGSGEGFGGAGIAIDSYDNVYVAGTAAASTSFPNPTHSPMYGDYDAYVSMLSFNTTTSVLTLDSTTFLGGKLNDGANAIAVDPSGNVYVTGHTGSTDFHTLNPFQATNKSVYDSTSFVAKMAGPLPSFSASSLSFGAQTIKTTSASKTLTVTNVGTVKLDFTAVVKGGTDPGDFDVTSDTCTGADLAPEGACTLDVTFTPPATGSRSATLEFTDSAFTSPQTVDLTGTGAVPVAGVSPSTLTFGDENEGVTSASQTVTLKNTGTGALTIASISYTTNFGETNTCGTTVAASGSCTIKVTFTPTTTGTLDGTLTITDNNNGVAGSKQTVSLKGTGLAAVAVTLSPSSKSLALGGTQLFTATISNAINTSLNWYVNGVLNGSSAQGTLTGSGLTRTYTAPSTSVPSPNPAVVKVASVEDPTKFKTANVTVTDSIVVTITNPSTTTKSIVKSTTQAFTASVKGTSDTGITWTVNGVANGNSTYGTITGSGLSVTYHAPASVPSPASFKVTATSTADPTKSASVTVTITP